MPASTLIKRIKNARNAMQLVLPVQALLPLTALRVILAHTTRRTLNNASLKSVQMAITFKKAPVINAIHNVKPVMVPVLIIATAVMLLISTHLVPTSVSVPVKMAL